MATILLGAMSRGAGRGVVGRVTRAVPVVGAVSLSLLGLFAPVASAAPGRDGGEQLYVAPWGRDSWAGTIGRPFATVGRAQQAVRARTARMESDIVVDLRGGTYALSTPLRLSAAAGDSGENGHRVIYQAHGYGTGAAEPVTISGGRTISGWRSAERGVWQADVGDLDTRQLFVDGRRAHRAALGGGLPGKLTRTKDGYVTDSAAPRSWRGPEDVELVYTGAKGGLAFSEARCGVARISGDAGHTKITMDQPCFRSLAEVYAMEAPEEPEVVDPTQVENSISFLTKPGSWYVDRSRTGHHVLSYLPRPGEDPRRQDITAPVLETLVSGEGTSDAPLRDISLRGLTFSYATWLAPSRPTGFPHIIGSWYYNAGSAPGQGEYPTVPGNVVFRTATRITIEGNRFTRLGSQALELSDGSSDSVVTGNVFDDVSGGGIQLGFSGNKNNRVENNWVHHIGTDYRGAIGISVEQAQDSTIAHNQVNDVPYTGIFGGPHDESPHGLRILNNRVFDTAKILPDGGGIYLYGAHGTSFTDGAVVRGNVVHDIGYDNRNPVPNAIYADVNADWITVQKNVLYRNNHSLGGVEPRRIRFTENFWDDPEPAWWPEGTPSDSVTIAGNTLLRRPDPLAACEADLVCAGILANAGLRPAYRRLLHTR